MGASAAGAIWAMALAGSVAGSVDSQCKSQIGKVLLAQGYITVSLNRYNLDRGFEVLVSMEGQSTRLILDTGAYYTSIVPALALRCKLVAGDRVKLKSVHGTSEATQHTVHGFRVGRVRSDFVGVVSEPAMVKLLAAVRADDGTQIEGVLGHDFLDHYAAVIDYANAKLYLLPPAVNELSTLTGPWKCVSAMSEGKPCTAADVDATRIDVAGSRIVFTTPGGAQRFHTRFFPEYEPKRLIIYQKAGDQDGGTPTGACQAYYKLAGDCLEICLKTNGGPADSWDKIPQDFKPKPKSGWTYFKLEREKVK